MNIKIEQSDNLKYIIRFPDGYKNGDRFPVIIFLHGAGSRGNDINILKNNPYFNIINKHVEFPFITVAPQCSQNTWFDMFEQLKRFVFKIYDENFTDKNKIYLMGASMGGYGTWQLAMSLPELFAAIVPICGGGMYWNASRLVNVPVWAFHGAKDTTVFKEESIKLIDAVNECGGKAKLTIYPENGHDAWSDTYNSHEVFRWLLSNTNKNNVQLIDKYKDGNIYG
ncbi:MAG: phospholipase [Ruminococcaceae bacterium]|nr:phospholipase [Oscillospiraceae bacterium]